MKGVEVHRGGGRHSAEEEGRGAGVMEAGGAGGRGAGAGIRGEGAGVAGAAVGRCCSWCRAAGSGSWEVGRVEVGRPGRILVSAGVLEGGRA